MEKSFIPLPFLLLALCLFFAGCKPSSSPDGPDNPDNPNNPDNPPVVVDMLDVSLVDIAFTAYKDASLIVVKTNTDWTATKTADWLTLSTSSGNKNTGFLIGAIENNGFLRETTVTIKSGDKTKQVKIRQAGAPKITIAVKDITFNMILVEGGEFSMGSSEQSDYGLPHRVKLSDFYISETEVANALWMAILKSLPYKERSETDKLNLPVSETTWNEITADFIPALNSASGKVFRLPTEAEWEFAAMGGIKSNNYKYAGSNTLDDVAWIYESFGGTKNMVKSKLPNELGLYDMSGNVSEWCSDWYGEYYDFDLVDGTVEVPELQTNPKGPDKGEKKIVRGGDFTDKELWGGSRCNVKYRYSIKPSGYDGAWGNTGNPDEPQSFFSYNTGFRLVSKH